MALEKAKLQEITSADPASPVGEPVDVQFNPVSLKLKLSNRVEGGKTRGRQARQYTGSSSTALTLELHFDTADEGTTGRPRSVREKTARVEKFVLPKPDGKQAPPRVRFLWGTFVFDGVIDGIDIDFDHFASDGTPLRARMGVTIQEQEPKYQYLRAGPGANRPPAGAADRVAAALGGESPAELAARLGLDPGAWRGLGLDRNLSAGLSLEAGLEVGFRADLSASAGLGVSLGVEAGTSTSVEASLGLAAGADARAAGLALSAAGGVGPALETAKMYRAQAASVAAREAFGATAARPAGWAGGAPAARPPLTATGPRTPAQQQTAPPAPPPPRADPRATGFGAGVPLRPRFAAAADERTGGLSGDGQVPARSGTGAVPELPSATAAPWLGLGPADPSRARADAAQAARRPRRPCGCRLPCRCGGRP